MDMTIQPFSGGTPVAHGQALPGKKPLEAAPPVDQAPSQAQAHVAIQSLLGLDEREEAYKGILSTPEGPQSAGGVDPNNPPDFAGKAISEMDDRELQRLFGPRAPMIRELGQAQPYLTGAQVLPLQGNPKVLNGVFEMLASNPDLEWEDLVSNGADGRPKVHASVLDGASRAGMIDRGEKPQDPDFIEKPIADMTEEQVKKLFGDQATKVREMGQRQPGLTGTQVLPLKKDVSELEGVANMLEKRPDLTWGDVVKVGNDGKTRVDPSVTDGPASELMAARQDLKPIELTQMAAAFHQELRDPGLAEAARKRAIGLLKERPDIKPQELTGLMKTLVRGQDGNAGNSPAAAVDMFNSSARLLTERKDMNVKDAERVGKSVLSMAGKKDPKSGMRSATAMSEAVDTLVVRKDMGADGIDQLAKTMNQRLPGQDESSSQDRHAGFSKGLSLMRQVPGMDAGTIGTMMQKASDGPPPRKGVKLLQAFDTMSQGVVNGRANMELMRDPLANPDPKGQKKRDGEMVLDKHGNEKGDAEDRPKVQAHQAAQGSKVEHEAPARPGQQPGQAGQPGRADQQGQAGQAGQAGQQPGHPDEAGTADPDGATGAGSTQPGQDQAEPRKPGQPG